MLKALFVIWMLATNSTDDVTLLVEPERQEQTSRSIAPDARLESQTYYAENLFHPVYSRFREGEAYVLDAADMKIKRYGIDGAYVAAIGNGRGVGPLEFTSPSSFEIRDDGVVYVHDRTTNSIRMISDGMEKRVVLDRKIGQFALIDSSFVTLSPSDSLMFAHMMPSGHVKSRFGALVESPEKYGLAMIGWVAATSTDVYYVSVLTGIMASYSLDGELNWIRYGIVRHPMPKLTIQEEGQFRSVSLQGNPNIYRSLVVSDGYIYVMSRDPDVTERILDVYQMDTGDYHHSILLSGSDSSLEEVVDGRFLVHTDTLAYMATIRTSAK